MYVQQQRIYFRRVVLDFARIGHEFDDFFRIVEIPAYERGVVHAPAGTYDETYIRQWSQRHFKAEIVDGRHFVRQYRPYIAELLRNHVLQVVGHGAETVLSGNLGIYEIRLY